MPSPEANQASSARTASGTAGATSFLYCNLAKCDVGMVIGGYAKDPYDDSGLEELMQDEDALEKSVKNFLECFKSKKFR
uniref:Uncharacterized protein n=1 Tax=Oryza nivara TaxID=4536 RepID=A0A0E0GSV1_ORYNI